MVMNRGLHIHMPLYDDAVTRDGESRRSHMQVGAVCAQLTLPNTIWSAVEEERAQRRSK